MTKRKHFYRRLRWTFCAALFFLAGFTWYYADRAIPDEVNIVAEEEEIFHLNLPLSASFESESKEVVVGGKSNIPNGEVKITGGQPVSFYSDTQGSYKVGVKLFGLLELKEMKVNVVDTDYAVPCGIPVGIYLKSKGVMVVGTGKITDKNGQESEPANGILKSGDYIEQVNGQPLDTKEQLMEAVNRAGANGTGTVSLLIRRDGQAMDVSMETVAAQDGTYKLGAWVRDDTQGIGTMTYMDLNGHFGALGHGISDADTGQVVSIEDGALYETQIMGIEKGTVGKPGVMSGVIYYGPQSELGTIDGNTEEGIFGTAGDKLKNRIQSEALPIGYRQDVHPGAATIRSSVSGEVRDYQIEILKVDYSTAHKSKGMVIKVTDPKLLALTGGIVQGMSGSPIMQDGKLIGAVTHVFVQDSTKGYGIFIENMLQH
ncbi:MAG: SpoIVB peptidase [Lachnospiraceae bacterium]